VKKQQLPARGRTVTADAVEVAVTAVGRQPRLPKRGLTQTQMRRVGFGGRKGATLDLVAERRTGGRQVAEHRKGRRSAMKHSRRWSRSTTEAREAAPASPSSVSTPAVPCTTSDTTVVEARPLVVRKGAQTPVSRDRRQGGAMTHPDLELATAQAAAPVTQI
jgi:hypothetical protein